MIIKRFMKNILKNNYLRKHILSYCPNKIIKCYSCKDICLINKEILKRFIEIPTKNYNVIYYQCLMCHWNLNTISIIN